MTRFSAAAAILLLLIALPGCGEDDEDPALGPGRGFQVERVRGTVGVDPPGATSFELEETTTVADGTRVDTLRGATRITARLPGGGTQSARLSGGRFALQGRRGGALTEITLLGRTCEDRSGGAIETRRLFGEGEGNFRTRGRFGAAGVRGTRWGVRDRCDGTLIVAREGTVIAEDFVTGRRVTLRAPRSYLARRR